MAVQYQLGLDLEILLTHGERQGHLIPVQEECEVVIEVPTVSVTLFADSRQPSRESEVDFQFQ